MIEEMGAAFYRSDTDKCPSCGHFSEEQEEHRRCPTCGTAFTEYMVLEEGENRELRNN